MDERDALRNVEALPRLVEGLKKLAELLANDPNHKEFAPGMLLATAEFVARAYTMITSLPEVVGRAKLEAMWSAYRETAELLREHARDIEKGRKHPQQAHSALMQVAAGLDRAQKEQRNVLWGEEKGALAPKKPKIILN